jgi:putative glutamine amidotransferase
MTKPVVVLPADIRHFDRYDWHATPRQYVSAAHEAADVVPLIVPAIGLEEGSDTLNSLLDRIDGVMLTGSKSNVDPALYGEEPTEKNGPYDRERDSTSLPLIRATLERGIPLLAICRGIQEFNVALGGTLATEIHEQEGNLDHRSVTSDEHDIRFSIRQQIRIASGSALESILGQDHAMVNSLHRQAVGRLAPGLEAIAFAEDGVIEAVSVRNTRGWALGVQWHPEYWARSDAVSKRLFEAFGKAARDYAAKRL